MSRYTYIDDFEAWRKSFYFHIDIRIRFSETDMFGHMNNVSSFIYFEEARISFMEKVGLFSLDGKQSTVPIVADLQCDYQKQVFFGETLRLYVKAAEVGNSSVDIHYLAVNEKEEVCFTGRGKLVNIDPTTGKSVALTEEQKAKLLDQNLVK